MVLACDPSKANSLLDMIPESWKIGKIVKSVSTE